MHIIFSINTCNKGQQVKIDCISDTHGLVKLSDLKWSDDADMLIIAGDFTRNTKAGSVYAILEEIAELQHKYKVVIAGNHDGLFSVFQPDWKSLGITYLENNIVEIEGLRIAGSPYTPKFCNWWFMKSESELFDMWDELLDNNIDILITHGPPLGILDKNARGEHCGSTALKRIVEKYKPRYHVMGHIHESSGSYHNDYTKFYNVSVLNGDYELENPITTIEVNR